MNILSRNIFARLTGGGRGRRLDALSLAVGHFVYFVLIGLFSGTLVVIR